MTELFANDTLPGDTWLSDHSWSRPTWTVDELVAAKRGRTISVVLPALNEEETVGSVVESVRPPLLGSLVDELIVLDSGSTDDTEIEAIAAAPGWSPASRRCPRSSRNPAKARCCGAHWPPRPVTSSCSSTPT